jgi:hypothetical protein
MQSQEAGICQFTNEWLRFDGRVLLGAASREPRPTEPHGLGCVTIRGGVQSVWAQMGASTNL